VGSAQHLQRPEPERKDSEQGDSGEAEDAYAQVEPGAAVEIGGDDRDGADAEAPGDPDTAPRSGRMGDEVAQRLRTGSAWGTSRPLRRTT
jgi:hypothetical protein